MSSWPQVREELLRLEALEPRVLTGYTGPNTHPEPEPPFSIRLTATSLALAEQLHSRFGDDVKLQVGALPFPPRPLEPWEQPTLQEPMEPGHTLEGLHVALDGPLTVSSGETARHGLLVTNESAEPITVNTNGLLTARIVDPQDGRHVGGSSGFQHQPLVRFEVAAGTTTRIPLLVGTASYVPDLGYTVPPGPWGISVALDLGGGQVLRSPILAFDVAASHQPLAD